MVELCVTFVCGPQMKKSGQELEMCSCFLDGVLEWCSSGKGHKRDQDVSLLTNQEAVLAFLSEKAPRLSYMLELWLCSCLLGKVWQHWSRMLVRADGETAVACGLSKLQSWFISLPIPVHRRSHQSQVEGISNFWKSNSYLLCNTGGL